MIQADIKKGQMFSTDKSVKNSIYLTMKDTSKNRVAGSVLATGNELDIIE